MVNRIWQHHFGQGLVRTPSDFGVRGEAPTHPELLEWLASEFVARGWSVKAIHRLILNSAAYQQGGDDLPAQAAIDPQNRWLWRHPPQRLEAEVLRDAILSVSGVLDLQMLGPSVKAPIPHEAMSAKNTSDPYPLDGPDGPGMHRRSVYLFTKRSLRQPLLEAFDAADPSASCPQRIPTTVAPQALALLNDPWVRRRSHDFAERLLKEANNEMPAAIEQSYRLALGRVPLLDERVASTDFVAAREKARGDRGLPAANARLEGLADFCQVIFGLNEFLYVD